MLFSTSGAKSRVWPLLNLLCRVRGRLRSLLAEPEAWGPGTHMGSCAERRTQVSFLEGVHSLQDTKSAWELGKLPAAAGNATGPVSQNLLPGPRGHCPVYAGLSSGSGPMFVFSGTGAGSLAEVSRSGSETLRIWFFSRLQEVAWE